MARLDKLPHPGNWDQKPDEDVMVFVKRIENQLNQLEKVSRKVARTAQRIPSTPLVGLLISFSVADGLAYYIVSTDRPRELVLQHVPFGDAYRVHPSIIKNINRNWLVREARIINAIQKVAER